MTGTAGATIKLRRDTSVAWATANTVLSIAEPGLDTTLNAIKYGDGVTAWNNLPYSGVVPEAVGNLIPAIGNTYSLGNVTNPWAGLYISGNTIYLGNVVLEASGNAFVINGNVVTPDGGNVTYDQISATGNITGPNISISGNVTGNYFSGNGAGLTGITTSNVGVLTSLSVTGNIDTGNLRTAGQVSAGGNVTAGNVVTAGVVSAASVTATGNVQSGNLRATGLVSVAGNVTAGNVVTAGVVSAASVTATGNVTANTFVGSGTALTGVMADRGIAPNNWNTMTQMGVYTVNRVSWSGTVGTPLDSQVYVGLVEVMNSTDTALEQVFYPGTVESGNVKIQWNRTYWNSTWTAWVKIINDDQVVIGGLY